MASKTERTIINAAGLVQGHRPGDIRGQIRLSSFHGLDISRPCNDGSPVPGDARAPRARNARGTEPGRSGKCSGEVSHARVNEDAYIQGDERGWAAG